MNEGKQPPSLGIALGASALIALIGLVLGSSGLVNLGLVSFALLLAIAFLRWYFS